MLWFLAVGGLAFAAATLGQASPMRIGLTPVFLDDQPRILKAWQDYLEQRLGRPVSFVQRGSYREITDLLLRGKLDVAWLCGLPYVERQARMSLVAVPLYQGAPLYRSFLIVPKDDLETASWEDLPAGVFAFSDPDSNSGYLYPRYAMKKAGIDPERHFRKTFFVHGHRNVVEAVAVGLADAGAVDAYVWETLGRDRPELTADTRVVLRSETFGFPPIVARADLPESEMLGLRRVLVNMGEDPEGLRVLNLFNLDGFVAAKPALYDRIADMSRSLGRVP
ncbi:MAG: phosphate/phosphite/phosphonate ABC transporter substrate-binding protein [Pseudomonadota bacterium]|nr:phosphate/phosphite/phosphonate ABC transporter substrate-binding protein [Pseudomonadota bacterium]